jgi:hypothetical protein
MKHTGVSEELWVTRITVLRPEKNGNRLVVVFFPLKK